MNTYRKNPILSGLLMLSLTHCGFGGKNADPLKNKDSSSYLTQSQKNQEQEDWQKKFEEKTQEYQVSIQDIQSQSDENIANLNQKYSDMQKSMSEKKAQSEAQCNHEKAKFSSDFSKYKTEQDQVISELKNIVGQWESKANSCEQILTNPDKQNFQGMLYQFELKESLPLSIEWTNNKEDSYPIYFKLDLGQKAVSDLMITPELPEGLQLVKKSSDTWTIEGRPSLKIADNQFQSRTIHYVSPVLDLSQIKDETIRKLVEQQTFEEKIMIVIQKTEQAKIETSGLKLKESAQ